MSKTSSFITLFTVTDVNNRRHLVKQSTASCITISGQKCCHNDVSLLLSTINTLRLLFFSISIFPFPSVIIILQARRSFTTSFIFLYILDIIKTEAESAITKSEYRKTSDSAAHNLALTLSSNHGSSMQNMLTLIAVTIFLSYL